ncbi:hypothetical protein B9W62_14570 [Streptomyces sp. CS113]|uniref:hypothetical protein n=1 Tax=Streptomyces sp. CS113 TaxID=1982761 RepID=UPI000B415D65|nr:hypothetical protein [Streptomyces sp. CS113]OWA09000.1 hypothetical protein B9W62_14570 [Streptomyces sp. CS113]
MTGVDTGAAPGPVSARAGATSALAAAGLALGVSAAAQVVRHDGLVTSALLLLAFLLTAGAAHTLGGTPPRSLPTALLALGLAVACPGGRWGLLLGGACCAVAAGLVTAALVGPAREGGAGAGPGAGAGAGSGPDSGPGRGSGSTPASGPGGGVPVRSAVVLLCLAVALGCAAAAVRLPEARAAASALACCCGLLQLTRTPVPG